MSMATKLTYAELFHFLTGRRFAAVPRGGPDRAFRHADTDTLLVFSWLRGEQDEVANADLVSAERFLREKQLIKSSLVDAVRLATAVKKM